MTHTLLLILGLICFFFLIKNLLKKDGIYQYPLPATAVFTGFVFVQLVGLSNNSNLPHGALDKTIIMTILCLVMVHAGAYKGHRPFRAFKWRFNQRRLLISSLVLSLIGAVFFFQISRLPVEMTSAPQWSGIVVAYRFFAQAMSYGLALAVLVYAATSSKLALGIVLFDLVFYLDRILISARRGAAAELIVILVFAFWFRRGWTVPRWIILTGMLLGTFFLFSTGDYRTAAREKNFAETVFEIDYIDNLSQVLKQGGSELLNSVYRIEAIDRSSDFDYGVFHWNTLVFNYVPAQLLGAGFKNSLLIGSRSVDLQALGHTPMTGSTFTGMSDSFRSFWYFGAIKFFLIAYLLARMYQGAVRGNSVMQLLYMLMIVNGLHAITHHTGWFVSPWVHFAIFLLPALLYAKAGAPLSGKPRGTGLSTIPLNR